MEKLYIVAIDQPGLRYEVKPVAAYDGVAALNAAAASRGATAAPLSLEHVNFAAGAVAAAAFDGNDVTAAAYPATLYRVEYRAPGSTDVVQYGRAVLPAGVPRSAAVYATANAAAYAVRELYGRGIARIPLRGSVVAYGEPDSATGMVAAAAVAATGPYHNYAYGYKVGGNLDYTVIEENWSEISNDEDELYEVVMDLGIVTAGVNV